jgi:hypothetical protein
MFFAESYLLLIMPKGLNDIALSSSKPKKCKMKKDV